MRKLGIISICIICTLSSVFLTACSGEEGETDTDKTAQEQETPEPVEEGSYDSYIRSALDSVNSDTPTADETAAENEKVVIPTGPVTADDMFVSSMENTDDVADSSSDDDPFATPAADDADASPSPTEDPDASPTPTPTPYITPEEFEVGKCCIYINGESDSAYGTEIVSAINKARTDLGYTALVSNPSLATCADRRTREIAARFDHIRPNGLPFYSLAPEHFKAEMLVINRQKAEDAVDTMIKRDPISRDLIFTNKYQSIGASSFKCNGNNYTVVSFGL